MPLPEAITSIPPKRLLLIAAGGIGAGLLWRHYSNKNAPASTQLDSSGNPVDMSQFALAANSAGNLSAGGGGGGFTEVPSSNDATRNFGSTIPLPITKGVVTGSDGIDYFVGPDGTLMGPVNPTVSTQPYTQPASEPTPAPTPVATPVATNSLPSWLQALKFVKGSGPAVYQVTPQGLSWIPNEAALAALGATQADVTIIPNTGLYSLPRTGPLPTADAYGDPTLAW